MCGPPATRLPQDRVLRSRMQSLQKAGVTIAILQLVFAGYSAALLSFATSALLTIVFGDVAWIDTISIAPTFLLPIVTGTGLAWRLRKHLTVAACGTWILPAYFFWRAYRDLANSPNSNSAFVSAQLLTARCGDSLCLYQMFYTAPLFCALAFSMVVFGCFLHRTLSAQPPREFPD